MKSPATPTSSLLNSSPTYEKQDDVDHTINEQRMKAPWNPPIPIEQLEIGQAFAAKGNEIIDNSQLMRWGYDNIKATGLFDKNCEQWRKKLFLDKHWKSFKVYFAIAEDDRKKNGPTAGETTYSVNQVQQILQDEINSILESVPNQPTLTDTTTTPASANASIIFDDVKSIAQEILDQCSIAPSANRSRNTSTPRNTGNTSAPTPFA